MSTEVNARRTKAVRQKREPEHQRTPDYPWSNLPDEELLNWRICDLKLQISSSEAEPCIAQLREELSNRGITFHPTCYLTTEWLCPDKIPAVGIPLCLAHPRLKQLEKTMMLEVEGGTEKTCMQLLRHETGHALNYAYRLYRRTRWRDLFGPFSKPYSEHDYFPRPYSRQFVIHLPDNYAQAHPDEDFAETFAVWLTPHIDWRKKYADWGAIRKLEYVDHLMSQVGARPPIVSGGPLLWPLPRLRSTLKNYYKQKRRSFADTHRAYYDPDLLKLFARESASDAMPAGRFLSRNRKRITQTVARWAHAPKYAVDHLVRRLGIRARELLLYLRGNESEAMTEVCVYLTALVCEQRTRTNEVEI